MPLNELDPITTAIRERALRAADRLGPLTNEAIEHLNTWHYQPAIDRLAELKRQIDHTITVISILCDWQAEAEKQTAKGNSPDEANTQQHS
jgi:hypothetical protein